MNTLTTSHTSPATAPAPATAVAVVPERPAPISAATTKEVDRIMLDPSTAFPALEAALDDPTTRVQTWELEQAQRELYEAGFLTGYQMAAPHLHAELAALRKQLARAEHDVDRYYTELCRRPAPPEPSASRKSFAELSRLRGEHARAARAEQHAAALARQLSTVTTP